MARITGIFALLTTVAALAPALGSVPFLHRPGLRRPEPRTGTLGEPGRGLRLVLGRAHCGLAAPPDWLDLASLHQRIAPADWQERLRQAQSRGDLAALRRATQTECPLGEPGFVEELEAKFGVQLRPLPPGRPTKKAVQSAAAPADKHLVVPGITRKAGSDFRRPIPGFDPPPSVKRRRLSLP